ncbi:conserved hypothetical protein (DUF1330) [Synechococcus sp. A18-40]|nr:conserved hypothetical protein (DUF1330) [Synechococcus sp. A18-40]
MTVVAVCKGKTLQDGIDFYKSPAYQELVKLRAPFTDGTFVLCKDGSKPLLAGCG